MSQYPSEYRIPEPLAEIETKRQVVIDRLTEAYATDCIPMEEYERRASAAHGARSSRDLEDLVADLPKASAQAEKYGSRTPSSAYRASPVPFNGPEMTIACVMGDRSMSGDWLSSDRVSSFTLMGSTKLDFRNVNLPPGPVRISAFTLMGETTVIVPHDLPVRITATPFMGEAHAKRDVAQNVRNAETWLEVDGFIVMGSLLVKALD